MHLMLQSLKLLFHYLLNEKYIKILTNETIDKNLISIINEFFFLKYMYYYSFIKNFLINKTISKNNYLQKPE